MSDKDRPTLTDRKGMGGIIASDGFDYQVWDALVRLPAWLRNPAFEGIGFETLEDFEARFFAPHAPRRHLLERYQAKSGELTRGGLIDVFKSFQAFENAHPHVARVQSLVTPSLPAKLTWISRDAERVRRARPFYSPFADIQAASDHQLRLDLITEFGSELGEFLANSVEVSLRPFYERALAEAAFSAEMQRQFPEMDLASRKLSITFATLFDLASQARGELLSRSRLLDVLLDVLGVELIPKRHVLALHVRSNQNGDVSDALEIDASRFSGGAVGFPDTKTWCDELAGPLSATADWARVQGISRIKLSGLYRLSTGFVLGRSFRSAFGFELDVSAKGDIWATDAHATDHGTAIQWRVRHPDRLFGNRLIVAVGIVRDPVPDVMKHWNLNAGEGLLCVTCHHAITSGLEAQIAVKTVKAAVVEAVAKLRPSEIDLCYVGPAAFSVVLGHRWNALPPTQVYEFVPSDGSYVATARLD